MTNPEEFTKAIDAVSDEQHRLLLAGCLLTYKDETISVHVMGSAIDTTDNTITTNFYSADLNDDVTADSVSLDEIYNYFMKGGETECN